MPKRIMVVVMLTIVTFFDCKAQVDLPTYEQFIKSAVPEKKEIDVFLHDKFTWAQFDAELGYILGNYMPKDGIDKSSTISTVQKNGARTAFMYKEQPCRINTYGNSFTQCHQVSDGETWQEYLAAHLGEPIRNFGMGGYGTYQAYRRLIREEKKHGAEYLIFYIWGDDHIRSLLRCRYLGFKSWTKTMAEREGVGKMFHNNFWTHIEMDLETGMLIEKESAVSRRKDLYKMTDPAWTYNHVKDDYAMQMMLYANNMTSDFDTVGISKIAKHLNVEFDFKNFERKTIRKILNTYSFAATKYTLDKLQVFAQQHQKKLMIVLLDPPVMFAMAEGKPRYEQEIVDYLIKKKMTYFDMNVVHLDDFKKNFGIPFQDYYKRYFIGHYSPAGNHFFAFSIKPHVVNWLARKPITYIDSSQQNINFEGYLQKLK